MEEREKEKANRDQNQ